jgi:filamentous hemagglutinin
VQSAKAITGVIGGALNVAGTADVQALDRIDLASGSAVVDGSVLSGAGGLRLASAGALTNRGAIGTAGALELSAGGDALNAGSLQAQGAASVTAKGLLNNTGEIRSAGLTLDGGSVTLKGPVASAGVLTVTGRTGDVVLQGAVQASGDTAMRSLTGDLSVAGGAGVSTAGVLTLDAAKALTQAGEVLATKRSASRRGEARRSAA